MRRPSRAQILQRWSLAAVLLLVAAVVAWGLLGRDGDDPETTTATVPAPTTVASAPTGAAPPTAPPTTGSTGIFVPDATGPGPVVGQGTLRTYRVEVEQGAGIPVEEFTVEVDRILSDPRGWTTADGLSLQRNPGQADMVITLATPGTVDFLCYPLDTDGDVSCAKADRAVINVLRWTEGAELSGLDLARYREYLISHEVGHVLGHHHEPCPGPGVLAPVMLQQTLGIAPCVPNPWPAPDVQAG